MITLAPAELGNDGVGDPGRSVAGHDQPQRTRRPARSMPLEFDKDEAVAGEQQRPDLCAVQLLRSRSCRNESRRRLSFLGAPRIASELLQLREQGTSQSFERLSLGPVSRVRLLESRSPRIALPPLP